MIRRGLVVAGLCGALVAGPVGVAGGQDDGPGAYAPALGVCVRKIVNLPLVDLPDQPIALVLGGQFRDCHP